jgi:hypothetical protein
MIPSNLYVQVVALFKSLIAKSMENSSYHSNVDFVVQLLNGFVGAILISVMAAIKSKSQGNTFRGCQKISYLSAKAKGVVQLEVIMQVMELSTVLDVEYVEDKELISKTFE